MSETEEQDFIMDYVTWMKGSRVQFESLHIYNFGYERSLQLPSMPLRPDSTLRFNLQTSGIQTPSRWSMVVIGEKYLPRFGEIMTVIDRIHEDTQALPFAIFLQSENEIKLENMGSHNMHETPALVGIFKLLQQSYLHPGVLSNLSYVSDLGFFIVLDRPCQSPSPSAMFTKVSDVST